MWSRRWRTTAGLRIAGGGTKEQAAAAVAFDQPWRALVKLAQAGRGQVGEQALAVHEVGGHAGRHVGPYAEDLGQEVARQAMRMGRDPNEIAEMMLHPDRIGALYADAYRRKTIDHVLEHVEITDAPPPEPEPEDTELEDGEVTDTEATEVEATEVEDTEVEDSEVEADEEE